RRQRQPQRPACGGLAAAAQHPVAQSAAAGWPRKPSLRRQKLDTTVERRNHYACTVVSELHRCVGCRCWPSEVAAPLSRRSIVVSPTATHLSPAEISLEATRERRVQQRDLPTSGPRSPQQWPPKRPESTEPDSRIFRTVVLKAPRRGRARWR